MAYHPISSSTRKKLRKAADASTMEAVAKESGLKVNTLARILHGTTKKVREETNQKIGAYLKRLRQSSFGPPPGPRPKKPQPAKRPTLPVRPHERHEVEEVEDRPMLDDTPVTIDLPWHLRDALLSRSIRNDISPKRLIVGLLEKGLSS